MSEHLRGERDDLHEVAVAQLAGHRAEDASAARVVAVVDQHGGVLVEGDVGAVVAPELLLRAHHHGGNDLALLHRAVRDGLLDGADDDVAHAGVAPVAAAAHADAEHLAGARVVRDLEPGLLLDHRARSSTSTRRQRFVRLSGRLSTTRTMSPVWASLFSSCADTVDDVRTTFLYMRCWRAVSTRTMMVLSALSETTTPWRTFTFGCAVGSGACAASPRGCPARRSRCFRRYARRCLALVRRASARS